MTEGLAAGKRVTPPTGDYKPSPGHLGRPPESNPAAKGAPLIDRVLNQLEIHSHLAHTARQIADLLGESPAAVGACLEQLLEQCKVSRVKGKGPYGYHVWHASARPVDLVESDDSAKLDVPRETPPAPPPTVDPALSDVHAALAELERRLHPRPILDEADFYADILIKLSVLLDPSIAEPLRVVAKHLKDEGAS